MPAEKQPKNTHRKSNHLIHETSLYLLQHAHNPVDWYPWCDEAWARAREEGKMALVSIGYSSCHWCHVMEHESFEDDSTADLMNAHFVCIKVDREARPDIDQVYMTAVQLMTGSGGWPLNCFTLPDGRPVYGGTYFPNKTWLDLLNKLHALYTKNRTEMEEYAEKLTEGLIQTELLPVNTTTEARFDLTDIRQAIEDWKKYFDHTEGGINHAPKFPMPNNYEFLLRYYYTTRDEGILKHVTLTLDKMAFGGIYDHVGGGFSRYSTDALWKVPHFEKMLYDNAQLVTLYSLAYQLTKKPLYRDVVYETLGFIARDMTSAEGAFYSALDADSEGKEGKYYVWRIDELKRLLGEGSSIFFEYYNVNGIGFWEHENYILLREKSEEELAKGFSISVDELKRSISGSKEILLREREKRTRPGLDDKQLTSWNALMIKAYCTAYDVFGEKDFLCAAVRCSDFILEKVKQDDCSLKHSYKNGKAEINGYLEDYAFVIEAFISLYQATFEEAWLNEARLLADYSIQHFHDKEAGMFYFTSDLDAPLIVRKKEIQDNVIPASNSSLAKGLYLLGTYFNEGKYSDTARQMLGNVKTELGRYIPAYSNWALLMLNYVSRFNEIVICGKYAEQKRIELNRFYMPNRVLAGSVDGRSALPLLEQRYVEDKTLLYVCENRACKLPVEQVPEAIKLALPVED